MRYRRSHTRHNPTTDQEADLDSIPTQTYNALSRLWRSAARRRNPLDVIKTARGTPIKRYKNVVGKQVGKQLYVHKDYAELVVPLKKLYAAGKVFDEAFPFNAVMYDAEKNVLRFDEAPDFDTAREPRVGRYFAVQLDTGTSKEGASDSIWHHKWLWVQDDYLGFDVEEAKAWSRRWAGALPEVAKGTKRSFQDQLDRYGIEDY